MTIQPKHRLAIDKVDNLIYSRRYLDANEQLENIRDVIPEVYYKILKSKLLEKRVEQR